MRECTREARALESPHKSAGSGSFKRAVKRERNEKRYFPLFINTLTYNQKTERNFVTHT